MTARWIVDQRYAKNLGRGNRMRTACGGALRTGPPLLRFGVLDTVVDEATMSQEAFVLHVTTVAAMVVFLVWLLAHANARPWRAELP